MKTLKELLYSKDHEWIKVDGDKAYVDITDFAQDSLGEIVFVELPEVDSEFSKGDVFGTVESVKAASDLCIPVSGKVLEVNGEISIEVSDKSELKDLLDAANYEKICDKEWLACILIYHLQKKTRKLC